MNKKFTIFDWLKEIMTNKRSWESFTPEQQNEYNPFLINKLISMNPDYIQISNYLQIIPQNKKKEHYITYCEFLPKKFIFSKYIKSSKKTSNNEVVEKLAQYYECSLGEAEDYIPLLRKEGVVDILNKLGVEEKEQKKLIKELK